jgi:hypothetical protein
LDVDDISIVFDSKFDAVSFPNKIRPMDECTSTGVYIL